MYLVVGDHSNRSLMTLLWGWASGREEYRDMTGYLVEKLGPGTYIYREDESVGRALLNIQGKYGRDESGKFRLRVMRVTGVDVDLVEELRSPHSGSKVDATEVGVLRILGDLMSKMILASGFNLDADARSRSESPELVKGGEGPTLLSQAENDLLKAHWRGMIPLIYKYLIQYPSPTEKDIDYVAWQLNVHPRVVEDLYFLASKEPSIYSTLRYLRFSEEEIPAWVKRPHTPETEKVAT